MPLFGTMPVPGTVTPLPSIALNDSVSVTRLPSLSAATTPDVSPGGAAGGIECMVADGGVMPNGWNERADLARVVSKVSGPAESKRHGSPGFAYGHATSGSMPC